MKREDLKKLELSDEAIDKVMALHGVDIEVHKSKATTAQAEVTGLQTQLSEANTQIESFKGMNIDQIKASADEWKTKAETAQSESASAILKIKQDHALERELKETFKVADLVAVKAHLKADGIKFNDKDETFIGLKEQLDPLKEKYSSYFSDFVKPPEITLGGNNQPITTDAFDAALLKGAGLTPQPAQGK